MGALGVGNTDYLKNMLKFEFAEPLLKVGDNDRLVLYFSTNWGYISGLASDTTLNPIELFRMGGNGLSGFGVTPLRGYEDQAVGPRNGGRVMARHIAEIRFAISQNPMPIFVYGFAEAGNVWSSLSETDPFSLKRAAGLGVQVMFQPFGIIGFSYGYGFDNDDITGERSGWKFLFHFGGN
jgi:outer membrane protein insertion porin family